MGRFNPLTELVMAAYDAGKSDSSTGLKRLADAVTDYDGYCGHALTESGRAEAEQLRPLRDAGKALVDAPPIERNPRRQDLNRACNDYYQVSRRRKPKACPPARPEEPAPDPIRGPVSPKLSAPTGEAPSKPRIIRDPADGTEREVIP